MVQMLGGYENLANGLFRNRSHVKQHNEDYLKCCICGKPVQLGADTTTDGEGESVHEDCQVQRILEEQRREPSISIGLA